MPDETEPITSLQRRLVVYQHTIEFLEVWRAKLGTSVPPPILRQISATCREIAQIKDELRQRGLTFRSTPALLMLALRPSRW